MRKTTLLLALLASAAVATTFRVWDGHTLADPQILLEEAQTLADAEPPQIGLAQRKINRALLLEPNASLRFDLIRERAELRGKARTYELALGDWQLLLEEAPGDAQILSKLAGIAISMGDSDRAIAIYQELLAASPTNGWIRAKLGKEQKHRADQEAESLHEKLYQLLPQTKLDASWPLILQASFLPATDPAREGLLVGIDAILAKRHPEALQLALGGISDLGRSLATPHESFVQSIESSVNQHNLLGISEFLQGSGNAQATADFGIIAAMYEAGYTDTATMQVVALSLEELGRPISAAAVLELVMENSPKWETGYLLPWCDILYRAQRWPQLKGVAWRLSLSAGNQADGRKLRAISTLYSGLANYELDEFQLAHDFLNQYVQSSIAEPFPDADALALIALADCYEAMGEKGKEKGALERCIAIAPDYSADVYKRAAKSIRNLKTAGLYEANYIAHAIRLDSTLAPELLPLFETAGEKGLATSRYNFDSLTRELSAEGKWYPDNEHFAYVLWHLANRYLDEGERTGAILTLRKLRRDYPGFAPAFDLESVILLLEKRHAERVDTLLERMAWTGPEPQLLRDFKDAIGRVDAGHLDNGRVLEWMKLDPSFAGSLELARGFLAAGKSAQAYTALIDTKRGLYNDSDRLLFAEILGQLEQHEGVLTATSQVSPLGPSIGNASLMRARAALFLKRPKLLDDSLATIESRTPELDEDLAREVLNLMISGGLTEPALRLAKVLATSEHSVSGRNLSLAAATSAIMGNSSDAREWVELANAFVDDHTPTLGLLLIHLQDGEVLEIAPLARQLRAAEVTWTKPSHLALLAALEGRLGEARALALNGLEAAPHDPTWHLLSAALNAMGATPIPGDILGAGLGKDARLPLARISALPAAAGRELVAMLLAKDAPEWSSWTDARLGLAAYRELLGPFGLHLRGQSAIAKGEVDLAKGMNDIGLTRWTSFTLFWDQIEQLATIEFGLTSAPQVASIRRRRRMANIPPRNGVAATKVELLLDSASETAGRGEAIKALAIARQAQVASPSSLDARLAVARLARETEPLAALNGYVGYLAAAELSPHFESERATEELISFLRVRSTTTPSESEFRARRLIVERILEARPDDPLLVIELSRLDALSVGEATLSEDREPTGLAVALERTSKFYRIHRHTPFDDLRPGAARFWFDFLVTYDPEAALLFANEQLELAPRQLPLWTIWARGLESTGEYQAALDAWRLIGQMTADPEVALETARLVGELGGDHAEVTSLLQIAERSPNSASFSRRLDYYRARSLVALSGMQVDQGVALLERILADTSRLDSELTTNEIDYTLGLSLLRRSQPGDGPRARKIFIALAKVEQGALRKQLLRALSGLANGLDRELVSRNP